MITGLQLGVAITVSTLYEAVPRWILEAIYKGESVVYGIVAFAIILVAFLWPTKRNTQLTAPT